MKKLLVVEDDPAILTGLKALLTSEDYDVISTSDGLDGEKLALLENPDLILLDINLPNLSGLEVCRKLREKNFNNPIFMLTSRNDQLDKIIGFEMGADDYITKPFDNREVVSRIRAHLRRTERDKITKAEGEKAGIQKRKLLTIFFSDIVGYSKSMHINEKLTLSLLEDHQVIMDHLINYHNGRIVELIGDAVLACFGSAVEAVECAVEVQKKFCEYNTDKKKNERINIRIGLHLGDVFEIENRLKGDTLNIAARIQRNGEPGQVYMSEQVYIAVKNKTSLKFRRIGEFNFKNISEPVILYSAK